MICIVDALCRLHVIGGDLLRGSRVVDVRWHPLSDHHLVVLTEDAVRMFDAREGEGSLPTDEWLLPPGALPSPPSALACGNARGWELLALLVLCEDGSLFYVTPTLPTGCLLPAADWGELLAMADAAGAASTAAPSASYGGA